MTAARFIGARFDREVVLLDRATNRLIYLEPAAVGAWERCTPFVDAPAAAGATPATVESRITAEDLGALAELEHAGVVVREGGRLVWASVQWT